MNTTATFDPKKPPFFLALAVILIFSVTPASSLLIGVAIGLTLGQPFPSYTKHVTKHLLQASIVGLGFGMDLHKVLAAGSDGFWYTPLSLTSALIAGHFIGRWLKVDAAISYLISVGTAICGGSAIAAVSQVMHADNRKVSVSIGIVFILNAVALLIFPLIGHHFRLDENTFGIWAAIAIHDTSSVVGAATDYGNEALAVATTIKLARALWIIPVTFLTAYFFKSEKSKAAIPWFIVFFLAASAINTYFGFPKQITEDVLKTAKAGFSVTLFLIGTGISKEALRAVGIRPLLQGVILWVLILTTSLILLLSSNR